LRRRSPTVCLTSEASQRAEHAVKAQASGGRRRGHGRQPRASGRGRIAEFAVHAQASARHRRVGLRLHVGAQFAPGQHSAGEW
jgi:hypothetical protein